MTSDNTTLYFDPKTHVFGMAYRSVNDDKICYPQSWDEVQVYPVLGNNKYTTGRYYYNLIREPEYDLVRAETPQPVTDAERQSALDELEDCFDSFGEWIPGSGLFLKNILPKLRRALSAPAPQQVDVDVLAQFIRRIDGSNSMGAAALSEAIASEYTLTKKVK